MYSDQQIKMAKANLDALEALILSRQAFEKSPEANDSRYQENRTTWDFEDIEGMSAIHYAVILGDLDKVKSLHALGASLTKKIREGNETPLQFAFYGENQAIIDYLLNFVDISQAFRHTIPPNFTSQYDTLVKEKILNPITQAHYLNRYALIPLMPGNPHNRENTKSYLNYAAEIEDLDFIKAFFNQNKDKDCLHARVQIQLKEVENPLITAIKNSRYRALQLLLQRLDPDLGPSSVPCKKFASERHEFFTSALHIAAKLNDWISAEMLLNHGANINQQDKNGWTPLYYALHFGNESFSKHLFDFAQKRKIKLDLTMLTFFGNSIFHPLAHSSPECRDFFMAQVEDKSIITRHNMYGIAPGQSYTEYKNENYAQNFIIPNLIYYLNLNYLSKEHITQKGICNALGFLNRYYTSRGKAENYFQFLAQVIQWDGCSMQSIAPFQTMDELLEYLNSVVMWYQHNISLTNNGENSTGIEQADRDLQCEENIHFILKEYSVILENESQLAEFHSILSRLPPGTELEFGGEGHLTSACVKPHKQFHYYDSNHQLRLRTLPTDSFTTEIFDKDLTRIEMDLRYRNLAGRSEHIQLQLSAYYFDWSQVDFTHYSYFKPEEFPRSKEDAREFARLSPNGFNHLHIATLANSVSDLARLVSDNHTEINALDNHGMDPLTISAYTYNMRLSKVLLSHPEINLINPKAADIAYKLNNFSLLDLIIYHPSTKELNKLLRTVFANNDTSLAKKLLLLKKVDHDNYAFYAYQTNHLEIVELILDGPIFHLPKLFIAATEQNDYDTVEKMIERCFVDENDIIIALLDTYYRTAHGVFSETQDYLFSLLTQENLETLIEQLTLYHQHTLAIELIRQHFTLTHQVLSSDCMIKIFTNAKSKQYDRHARLSIYYALCENTLSKHSIAIFWPVIISAVSEEDREKIIEYLFNAFKLDIDDIIPWLNVMVINEQMEAVKNIYALLNFLIEKFVDVHLLSAINLAKQLIDPLQNYYIMVLLKTNRTTLNIQDGYHILIQLQKYQCSNNTNYYQLILTRLTQELDMPVYSERTIAHLLCSDQNMELFNALLPYISAYHLNLTDKNGDTALHRALAVKNINVQMIQSLIEKGGDISIANNSGWTPLEKIIQLNEHLASPIKLPQSEFAVCKYSIRLAS